MAYRYKRARSTSKRRAPSKKVSGKYVGYSKSGKGKIVKGYTRRAGNYGRYNLPGKIMQEIKYVDNFLDGTAGSGETNVAQYRVPGILAQVGIGGGVQNRIGRKINLVSLHAQLRLSIIATELAFGAKSYDMYIVLDTQTNGTAYNIADVWASDNGDGVAPSVNTVNLLQLNKSNQNRFKILKHKHFTVTPQAISVSRDFQIYIPLNDLTIEWDQTTAGLAGQIDGCRSNSLSVVIGESGTPSNVSSGSFTGIFRIMYKDS